MYEMLNVYLENGLKVIMHKIPNTGIVSCGMWIRQGSKYENDNNNGISHLLEHLMLSPSSTNNKRYRELLDDISFNGVVYNGVTTKESTAYYFTGLSKMLDKCLEALKNIVIYNSDFNIENIDKEKNVVVQEAISYYSSYNQILERTNQALWGNMDIGRVIVGNIDNIRNATIESLKEIVDSSYTPENSILIVIGDIDYDEVLKMIEDKFSIWEDKPTRIYNEITTSDPGIYFNSNKSKNATISIGFRIPKQHNQINSSADIISTILGNPGLESRLVKEIRSKRGLAYSVNSFTLFYENKGTIGFNIVCENKSVDEIVKVTLNEILKIRESGPEEEEIVRAKNILETKAILSMNDITNHIKYLGKHECTNKVFSLENEIRRIKKCTNNEMKKMMYEVFHQDNMSFAGIGNFDIDSIVESLVI